MAAAYLVTLPADSGQTRRNGVNAVVVHAEDATQAKDAAGALYDGDNVWSGATATAIAAADYNGWTMRVKLQDPAETDPTVYVVDVSVTGDGTNNTIDELAALMVTALNATTPLTAAAYDATGNVLTVVDASVDALGDHILSVEFTHPDFALPVASLVGTITDQGTAGSSDVTVALKGDSVVTPKLYGALRSAG